MPPSIGSMSRAVRLIGVAITATLLALAGCGGGGGSGGSGDSGSDSGSTAATYQVGGTISGLSASGLVLLDNGGDATTINANAQQFTMNTALADGAAYDVTVQTEPMGLACTVNNGAGTVGAADVTSISITCVSNFTPLYSFTGAAGAGAFPLAGLIEGSDGNLYGTTQAGGNDNGDGTVFQITPEGAETTLYSFAGPPSDGSNPVAGLTLGSDGNFYGATNAGGANGDGTVFEITSAGAETVLYSFAGGTNDGAGTQAGLVEGSGDTFYGTTDGGGASGDGTVFEITSAGTESVLHSFAGGSSDGAYPVAGLILGNDGSLYGTTKVGGANGDGTVYKITPDGTKTVLYSFAGGGSDGAYPVAGLILGSDGNFYGTTEDGGPNSYGTVFKITPDGIETVLYFFAGGSADGANPYAGLIQGTDGNLYGTTREGGANGYGTVFEITLDGTETVLHSFAGAGGDGLYPVGGLIEGDDGNLYGTTDGGGTGTDCSINGLAGCGTVFKITLQ